MISVVEYTPENAHLMRADYIARRARLYAVPPEPVVEVVPEPAPEPEPVVIQLPDLPRKTPAEIQFSEWLDTAAAAALRPPQWKQVLETVSRSTRVSVLDIKSERRQVPLVEARMIAFHIMRTVTSLSFPRIGLVCGGRDHTTILHGCRRMEERILAEPSLALFVCSIIEELIDKDPGVLGDMGLVECEPDPKAIARRLMLPEHVVAKALSRLMSQVAA